MTKGNNKEMAKNNEMDGYEKIDSYNFKTIKKLAVHYHSIIGLLGEDSEREGLRDTPNRVAKSMQFLTHGYLLSPDEILRSALFHDDHRQMIIVKNIELYSLCEHHMIPFFGKAHVAYIPDGQIVGLSKIARVVDAYARRLQVQERLTKQIVECIQNTLNPLGVAVVIEAIHMCMSMRGIQKQNSVTTTSDFTGAFLKEATRQEFISLIGSGLH